MFGSRCGPPAYRRDKIALGIKSKERVNCTTKTAWSEGFDEGCKEAKSGSAFKEWVRSKEVLDRSLDLFSKLDSSRAESEKSWADIAVSLAAVDCSMNPNLEFSLLDVDHIIKSCRDSSIFHAFKKWTMQHCTFKNVVLSKEELRTVSKGYIDFMETDPNLRNSTLKCCLPSLRYQFQPPRARNGTRNRGLTPDQRAGNKIFLKCVRDGWIQANQTLHKQLEIAVQNNSVRMCKSEMKENNNFSLDDDRKCNANTCYKSESKNIEHFREDVKESIKPFDANNEHVREEKKEITRSNYTNNKHFVEESKECTQSESMNRAWRKSLDVLGIKRLIKWLEEDEESKIEKAKIDDKDRVEEARRAHSGWDKRKKKLLLNLPDEPEKLVKWQPPRFDFSAGKGLVRPNKQLIAHTTVDLMRGTSAKHAYAMNSGHRGQDGDLEKSKQQLKEYEYETQIERKEQKMYREIGRKEAFEAWLFQKDLVQAALSALKHIDLPCIPNRGFIGVNNEKWIQVGKALKSIDTRLSKEWTDWCLEGRKETAKKGQLDREELFENLEKCSWLKVSHFQALWDFFPPRSCDIHSAGYSPIRETFLKLLKPGIDYKEGFKKVMARRQKFHKNSERGHDKSAASSDSEDEKDLSLTKLELSRLLTKELGVTLSKDDMRRLIDAFDTKKDQRISWREFEAFTGGKRGTFRGDFGEKLKQRCVWETTCLVTGMCNAYVVSAPRVQPSHAQSQVSAKNQWIGSRTIKELGNGELRSRTELPERAYRHKLLVKLGLLASEDDEKNKETTQEGYGSEEFEDDNSHGGSHGGTSPIHNSKTTGMCIGKCAVVTWTASKRKDGLQRLKQFAEPKRKAEELKTKFEQGVTPKAPKFWSVQLEHPDVQNSDLISELLLRWRPHLGTEAAFFSLEMATADGSKSNTYAEIFRDPPYLGGAPQYEYWVRELLPNTCYKFRIRGFNGFGGGKYAQGNFCTRPTAPPAPVVIGITPTEVSLRWEFQAKFREKVQEIREFFNEADVYECGQVDRDEFLVKLKGNLSSSVSNNSQIGSYSSLIAFLKSCYLYDDENGLGCAVFEAIRQEEEELLSWHELSGYFEHCEYMDGKPSSWSNPTLDKKAKFILEHLDGEGKSHSGSEREVWQEVWSGNSGEATAKNLTPGTQYRFRVVAVNADGILGPPGEGTSITTLLDTPLSPMLFTSKGKGNMYIGDTSIRFRWAPVKTIKGNSDEVNILHEWSNVPILDCSGVKLALVFKKYDHSGNGTIDPVELGNLLEDMGTNPTKERLHSALADISLEEDGSLCLNQFEKWWSRKEITYVLKRDKGVSGCGFKTEDPKCPVTNLITVYRGHGLNCEVAGLVPNTMYKFYLMVTSSQAESGLSPPVEVMTAPKRPYSVVVIRTEVFATILKLYPGQGGCHKYCLQSQFIENLDTGLTARVKKLGPEGGWEVAYEGVENCVRINGLQSASVYRFRVAAMNRTGSSSSWSEAIQMCTLARKETILWKPALALTQFPVECNGDIAVGDMIVFTEKVCMEFDEPDGDFRISKLKLMTIRSGTVLEENGTFFGERTIAAHVIKDLFSTAIQKQKRDESSSKASMSARRSLKLQIIWCTVSHHEASIHLLSKETIIDRTEKNMSKYDVYRAPWKDEVHRKCVKEEWALLGPNI